MLLKIDFGYHRIGVLPENALEIARHVAELPGLHLRGVFTHAGQVYHGDPGRRRSNRTLEGETLFLRRGAPALGAFHRGGVRRLDPVRPPRDARGRRHRVPARQLRLPRRLAGRPGHLRPRRLRDDDPRDRRERPGSRSRRLDAGSKTLSQDTLRPRPNGHGLILGTQSRLQSLSEEHGIARVEEGDSFAWASGSASSQPRVRRLQPPRPPLRSPIRPGRNGVPHRRARKSRVGRGRLSISHSWGLVRTLTFRVIGAARPLRRSLMGTGRRSPPPPREAEP